MTVRRRPPGIKGLHDSEWAVLGEPDAELVKAVERTSRSVESAKRRTE